MQDAGYRIEPDLGNRLIRMTLYGFWDEATLLRYQESVRKLAASAAQVGPAAEGFRILIDLRDHDLLSKDHASKLQETLGSIGGTYRTAMLVSQFGLLKRQVERVSARLQPMFFTSESEAMAWLSREPVPA